MDRETKILLASGLFAIVALVYLVLIDIRTQNEIEARCATIGGIVIATQHKKFVCVKATIINQGV